MNQPKFCKNCQIPIKGDCQHIFCLEANERGFCHEACECVYKEIIELEMNITERKSNG